MHLWMKTFDVFSSTVKPTLRVTVHVINGQEALTQLLPVWMNVWSFTCHCQAAKEPRLRKYGVWSQRTLTTWSMFINTTLLSHILPLKTDISIYLFRSRPVHGLIFLFKWQPGEEPAGSIVQDSRLDHIFFAKQVSSLFICTSKT